MHQAESQEVLSTEEFTKRLRAVGEEGYHDKHPFHLLMHEGKLTRPQLQAWIANRFYYQALIPKKDAAILGKSDDPAFRRAWIHRIIDHDGTKEGEGGIHKWLVLAEAAGLKREEVEDFRHVLPGVQFAVDGYLMFVQSHSLVEAVASSLTELFAPKLHAARLPAFEEHYPWVNKKGLEYFRSRLVQAPKDVEYGLRYVLEHCTTRDLQEKAIAALTRKCHILWSLLDSLYFAYISPGWPPSLWPR
ncbi:MAG: pyrroloquinoline-quinone synthase PqqC [Candidatus Methylomirabilis sp.]